MKKVADESPESAEARRNLGHAYANTGDLDEAEKHLTEAVKLSDGRDPLTLHLLSRVFVDTGNLPAAVQADKQALVIANEQNNSRLVQAVSTHLVELIRKR